MLALKTSLLFSLLFIFGMGTACGQTRPKAEQDKAKQDEPKFEVTVSANTGKEAERRLKEVERLAELGRKFTEEDRKCRSLLKTQKLEEAENVCKAALQLAEQLEPESKFERMRAYESVGHVMLGQKRYAEALRYYSRAFDLGQPQYTEEDASLGRLYGNLALAQHMLGDLNKARELYRKSEQIYHRAYLTYDASGDTAESNAITKQSYLNSLKLMLKYHRMVAEETGATSEIEEIDKLMKSLP